MRKYKMVFTHYPYNFDGTGPQIGEITHNSNLFIEVLFEAPLFISYLLSQTLESKQTLKRHITEPHELLMLSTTNPAHSLGEFTSFLEYYSCIVEPKKVCINSSIVTKMPYLFGLITLFIPDDKLTLIDTKSIYLFDSITMRRNDHFVYTTSWDMVPFTTMENVLTFTHLQYIRDTFSVNCNRLLDKMKDIYESHKHKYVLHESIMIIKTTKEKLSVSIHRAIAYPEPSVLLLLAESAIKMIEVSQFADIYEYICTLYHAKNIIFSYGGPMCINRFFCNPDANIVVLANLHYKPEYDYNNSMKTYWHLRHAMLAPVQKQQFILDFDNALTIDNTRHIISLLTPIV